MSTKGYDYDKLRDRFRQDIIEFEAIYEQLMQISMLVTTVEVFVGDDFSGAIKQAKESITSKMTEAKYFLANSTYLKDYVDAVVKKDLKDGLTDIEPSDISFH